MNAFMAELLGTAMLIIFGNGVVANVVLKGSKGQNGGWIVIATGWAMAVFIAVYCVAPISGAHLNPCVTLALALLGKFEWSQLPMYFLGQMIGAFLGAIIVFLVYRDHFNATEKEGDILACFSTSPAIKNKTQNFTTELIATFVFMMGVFFIQGPTTSLGALDALPVALLVFGIGLSLGGPTGYAINPARDLGPRLAHAILPLKNKGQSDWAYAWLPIVAPLCGAALASCLFLLLQ